MALSKFCPGAWLKKRREMTTNSQNSCVVGGVQTGRLLNTCLALYRLQVGSTAVLTDYPVQTLGLVLLGGRRWRKVDVVCRRIGVVDDAGGGLRRRMALEGLELAGAPDASVEELVLLSHAIFLSLSPPYSFLQWKEAGPYWVSATLNQRRRTARQFYSGTTPPPPLQVPQLSHWEGKTRGGI